jgi:hypothetical protein
MSGARARQGVTGHNARYVLGFGLAGAIIALTVLYLFYFAAAAGAVGALRSDCANNKYP